jgi:Flp pilus assembly protein TadD
LPVPGACDNEPAAMDEPEHTMRNAFRSAASILTTGLILGFASTACRRPADPAALADGLTRIKEKDYPAAIVRLREAVRGNPRDVTAQANLGIAYWRAGAAQSATRPLLDAASLSDNHPRVLEILGLVYTELGDWPAATDCLRRAQERSGQPTPRVLTERGIVEFRAGRAPAAESLFQEALRLNGDYPPALFNLAVLNRDRQNPDAAAIYFGRYVLVAMDASRVAAARRFIGQAEAQKRAQAGGGATVRPPPPRTGGGAAPAPQRADPAVATQKVETVPDPRGRPPATTRKSGSDAGDSTARESTPPVGAKPPTAAGAQPQAAAGQSSGAKPPAAESEAQVKRREAIVASSEGLRLHKMGDLSRAIPLYRQALALDPKLEHVHYNLGLAYDQKGDSAQAAQAFANAIAVKPDMLDARYMLAVSFRRTGELERATAETKKLLTIDASYAKGHLLLGMLHEQLRRPDLARAPYEEFLRLDPKNPSVDRIRQWLRDNPAPSARHGSPPLPRSR